MINNRELKEPENRAYATRQKWANQVGRVGVQYNIPTLAKARIVAYAARHGISQTMAVIHAISLLPAVEVPMEVPPVEDML